MKSKGLLLDAVVGLILTLGAMFCYLRESSLLASLEFKAYDLRSSLRQTLKTPEEIVLVTIDDDSIAQIGRWPWPRSRVAAALDKISQGRPRVIGLNILYSEPEQNLGLAEIKRLKSLYDQLRAQHRIVAKGGTDFDMEFSSSAAALDSDSRLLASIRAAGNVVLMMHFAPNPAKDKPNVVAPEVSNTAIHAALPTDAPVPAEDKLVPPLTSYAAAAAGLAHSLLYPEIDGVFRRDAPLVLHDGLLYPSYALRLVMSYHGIKPSEVRFKPGVEIAAARLRLPLDAESMMPVTFLGPPGANTIKHVSFQAVMNGGVSADYFKDKIVIIGPTARGVGNEHAIPLGGGMADVEIAAHAVENILHQRFLTRPPWAERLEWGMLGAIGFFLMLLLPRMRALWGLVASLLLAIGIAATGTYFFWQQGQWIKIGYALALLSAGYVVIVSRQFLLTERDKEVVEAGAIETNKMLGLSFQGQGMLDLAFEKFRLCPVDGAVKELLYNLALDFERKRQFSKAASVLERVSAKDSKYRDVAQKIKMLKAASQGAVFGGVGGRRESTVLLTASGGAKPTLGRYEIEKELGRGAMGVVYLGRDPKINRMVAIKTMMLEESGDASAKEVKERFFREAESAGTLNHPNIVRIFDAGEENDVAYIAMELLDGQDLTGYCSRDRLLPLDKVLEYAAVVADALDYAHRQGIVHRDIKPANVMFLKDGSVRVADFGIARITASSKTASGTVMGTPSYMSPEQVAGRKVDGRSDLFSLCVVLFELATGEKPFKGGDSIGTLLFQIANDPHPDPRSIRPELPASLKTLFDKGLAKKPEQRFQSGSELATAIRSVLAEVKAGSLESILPTAPVEEKKAPTYVPPPQNAEEQRKAAPPADAAATIRAADGEDTITMPVRVAPVGPEIAIPGVGEPASEQTVSSEPTAAPAVEGMRIELSPRAGIIGAPPEQGEAPAPDEAGAQADTTIRLAPPSSQEPS